MVTHDLSERAGSARDDGQSGCECLHDGHGEILVALRWNYEKARILHERHHALCRLLPQPLDSGTALIHPPFERTTTDDPERVWRGELRPGVEQHAEPFLRRQSPDEQAIAAGVITDSRVAREKIRLYGDSVLGKPALGETATRELRQCDVHVHHAGPRSASPVPGDHRGSDRGRAPASSVATVDYSRPRDRATDALLACVPVPEEQSVRADEPEVV